MSSARDQRQRPEASSRPLSPLRRMTSFVYSFMVGAFRSPAESSYEATPIELSERDTKLFDSVMQSDCRPNTTLRQLGERYRKAKANGTIQIR